MKVWREQGKQWTPWTECELFMQNALVIALSSPKAFSFIIITRLRLRQWPNGTATVAIVLSMLNEPLPSWWFIWHAKEWSKKKTEMKNDNGRQSPYHRCDRSSFAAAVSWFKIQKDRKHKKCICFAFRCCISAFAWKNNKKGTCNMQLLGYSISHSLFLSSQYYIAEMLIVGRKKKRMLLAF